MALRPVFKVSDRWFAQLNATVDSSTTSWVLKSSGATGLPTLDSLNETILHCGSEKVRVSAVAVDTPSAGLDTLTVERGYGGSSAAGHAADTYVGHFYYREYHNDIVDRLQQLERFLYSRLGKQNGVIRDGATPGLQVKAEGTPSMTVDITAGAAIAAAHPVSLRADTTLTFPAPTTNPRIDIVTIDVYGNIEAVTGTEDAAPSAPATPSDAYKLAEIYHRVGEASIKDTDDASNGYITDSRTYI